MWCMLSVIFGLDVSIIYFCKNSSNLLVHVSCNKDEEQCSHSVIPYGDGDK